MKRIALTVLISALTVAGFAQKGNLGDNPEECKTNLSLYGERLEQKSYNDAYKFWVKAAAVCPEYSSNLYDNGVYIMKRLKDSASDERKKALTDSIIWAYEQNIKYFGDNPGINEDFGGDLIIFGRISRGVDLIKKALDSGDNTLRASTIYYYSNGLAVLKNKEKKDCEVLVLEYERLSKVIENNKESRGYDQAQIAIDRYLGPCLSCDNLLPIIRKKFEKAKTDDNERKKILSTLKKRECTNNDIFVELTIIEAEKNPSAEIYLYLAQIYINKGDKTKAKVFYDKAIDLAETDEDKVKYMMAAASNFRGSAGSYANDALDINPNCGAAILIKARIIASSKCGTSAFDDRAINWAAYDMAAKAKSVDPSVASEASKAMASYRAGFPTDTQKFEHGYKTKGASYKTCNGYSTTVK